jgi:hypothetical protein
MIVLFAAAKVSGKFVSNGSNSNKVSNIKVKRRGFMEALRKLTPPKRPASRKDEISVFSFLLRMVSIFAF